jgi:hypothetical protein
MHLGAGETSILYTLQAMTGTTPQHYIVYSCLLAVLADPLLTRKEWKRHCHGRRRRCGAHGISFFVLRYTERRVWWRGDHFGQIISLTEIHHLM